MNEDTIIRLVEGLRRQGNDPAVTEQERDAFLTKAQQLIDKYKIDEARLRDSQTPEKELYQVVYRINARWTLQQIRLAWAFQELFHVECIGLTPSEKHKVPDRVRIVGMPEDVKFFSITWIALGNHMLKSKDRLASIIKKVTGSRLGRSWHYSYIVGYIMGVTAKVNELTAIQRANSELMAIIKVESEKLQEYMEQANIKLHKDKTNYEELDPAGLNSGRRAGYNSPIGRLVRKGAGDD